MSKRTPRSSKATPAARDRSVSDETGRAAARSIQDRPDDPLFVPHLDEIEAADRASRSGGDVYASLLESICGATDDSQPVEQYNGTLGVTAAFVSAHQSAACQVQWNNNLPSIYTNPGNVSGVRWGSGTMISGDLFLTCGHLFDQTGGGWERPRQNGTTNIISPQEIARNMRLNFNFQVDPAGNLRAEQSFPILELLEYRLGGLDMAVCRIGGNPGATFGRTLVSTTDAVAPEMLCIIGHPAGQPKRIEAGPTTLIDGNLIRYSDIDTLGGNSGSGILRASDGRLVGIHTNGGCNPAGTGSNFGQRIAAVIAASPILQALPGPVKFKIFDDPPKPTLDKPVSDTPVTLKFRDDIVKPTLDKPVVDTPVTLKFRDDIAKPTLDKPPADVPVTLKFRDDVFKPPVDGGLPGRPFPPRPPGGGEALGARPFILSTPHHSTAWSAAAQETGRLDQLAAALAQIEQLMAAGEAELAQLDAEYRQLLAEYEAAGGRRGGS